MSAIDRRWGRCSYLLYTRRNPSKRDWYYCDQPACLPVDGMLCEHHMLLVNGALTKRSVKPGVLARLKFLWHSAVPMSVLVKETGIAVRTINRYAEMLGWANRRQIARSARVRLQQEIEDARAG